MFNIVIPMGGEGKRFAECGYTFPKPLVEIAGRSMVEIVVQNLVPKEAHRFIFICNRDHLDKYALGEVLHLISPGCRIVSIRGQTAGALCSVLLAMEYLDSDDELLIANADQFVEISIDDFLMHARKPDTDGCIMTFPATHPKWSYAKTDDRGEVLMVAEKRPISQHATTGIYYFRRSSDFVDGAEQMILKNTMTAGEYYVCPVYNELILKGKKITVFPITREQMHSLGTPEDVASFANSDAATLLD
jgi:NDP-sugar pyrophosphorylase family protein